MKQALIEENDYLLKKRENIEKEYEAKKSEVSALRKSIETYNTQIDYLYSKVALLEKEIEQSQTFLDRNKKETAQIYGYVNEQNNKLISMASE